MRITTSAAYAMSIVAMLGLNACATVKTAPAPGDNIARLEKDRTDHPNSAPVLRALGINYYEANRLTDARAALEAATKIDPADGVTALYLGLTAEGQNDLPAARAAYSSYVKVGRTQKVRSQLEQRLALLQQKELKADADAAMQREASLSATPGSPTTIAVLPFKFTGADTTLRPLERGFAELLTTDLSRAPSLTVVERARLQAILDETALQQSGATDAATNVRAGHLLQAGRLVSGSIIQNGNQLRADAGVVTVSSGQIAAAAPDNQALDQVFTLEKNIAFNIFATLNVTLTTAQRNAIEQRPTQSLQAFLSYSRGLQAEDEGRYNQASGLFQDATRLDPNFGAAAQKSKESRNAGSASQVTPATVESELKGSSEGTVVTAANQGNPAPTQSGPNTASNTANALNPSPAQAAAQSGGSSTTTPSTQTSTGAAAGTGGDNPTTQSAHVIIVVPRPPLE